MTIALPPRSYGPDLTGGWTAVAAVPRAEKIIFGSFAAPASDRSDGLPAEICEAAVSDLAPGSYQLVFCNLARSVGHFRGYLAVDFAAVDSAAYVPQSEPVPVMGTSGSLLPLCLYCRAAAASRWVQLTCRLVWDPLTYDQLLYQQFDWVEIATTSFTRDAITV